MTDKIDLNTADEATLATLPGIGEATAQRIVAYREAEGPFTAIEELTAISGISKNIVRSLADQVEVLSPTAPESEIGQGEAEAEAGSPAGEPETVEETPAPAEEAAPMPPDTGQPEPPVVIHTEPVAESSTPAAVQSQADYESRAVRRGCFSAIFGAVLGALLGAVLTLSVLFWLNSGSLTYSEANRRLRNQLDDEINEREAAISAQATTMSDMATQQAGVEAQLDETVAEVEKSVATAEAEMAELRETAVGLETRIAEAANAADTLDAFLIGLDTLLTDIVPGAGTPAPSRTIRPTASATGMGASTPAPTGTAVTRTPQPTATPLPFASGTPDT